MEWKRAATKIGNEADLRKAERRAMKAGVGRVKAEARLAGAKQKVEILTQALEKAKAKEAKETERVNEARKALAKTAE